MKKLILMMAIISICSVFQMAQSCPTCVGRIQQESPPFFSDEFYQTNAESMDYLYEQLMAEEKEAQEQAQQKEIA